jgi:hypothetical protein
MPFQTQYFPRATLAHTVARAIGITHAFSIACLAIAEIQSTAISEEGAIP